MIVLDEDSCVFRPVMKGDDCIAKLMYTCGLIGKNSTENAMWILMIEDCIFEKRNGKWYCNMLFGPYPLSGFMSYSGGDLVEIGDYMSIDCKFMPYTYYFNKKLCYELAKLARESKM